VKGERNPKDGHGTVLRQEVAGGDEDLVRESKLTSVESAIVRGECGSSGSEPTVAARKDRWGQFPMTHNKNKADAVVRDKVPFSVCKCRDD